MNNDYTFPLIQLGWEYPAFLVGLKTQIRGNFSPGLILELKKNKFVGFVQDGRSKLLGWAVLDDNPRVESTLLCGVGDYLREGYGALHALDCDRITPFTRRSPPEVWTARHESPAWLYVLRWRDPVLSPDAAIAARQWHRRLSASGYLEGLRGLDYHARRE